MLHFSAKALDGHAVEFDLDEIDNVVPADGVLYISDGMFSVPIDIETVAVATADAHRTDETPGEYNALPEGTEDDSLIRINNDGNEYSIAIERLDEEPNVSHDYLGWTTAQDNIGYFRAWKGKFYLSCVNARDLVTAIFTLETNGVTDPEPDEVGQ